MGKGGSKGCSVNRDGSTCGMVSIAASNGWWFVDTLALGTKHFHGVQSDFVLESNR
jgi:hypothetical protein